MPSFTCLCGSRISLSPIPHPDGYRLFDEEGEEALFNAVGRLHQSASSPSEFARGLSRIFIGREAPAPHIFQCARCGRLAVLKSPSDPEIRQWYQPDESDGTPAGRLSTLFERDT